MARGYEADIIEITDPKGGMRRIKRRIDPPAPGEILVAMRAASLNFRDILMRQGFFPGVRFPYIPLSDGAGEVIALGEGVEGLRAGDMVSALYMPGWYGGPLVSVAQARPEFGGPKSLGGPTDGVLASIVKFDARDVVRVSDHLAPEEAAAFPVAGVTAWRALERSGVGPGQIVLVEGTGGVSIFALQIAKIRGAQVIVTSSSDAKLERAQAMGADYLINRRARPEWGAAAMEVTNGRGVDAIVDIGGGDTLSQAIQSMAPGGYIGLVGILEATRAEIEIIPIIANQITLEGAIVGSRADFRALDGAFAAHKVKPVVDRVFAFDELDAALDSLGRGDHFGNVGIRF